MRNGGYNSEVNKTVNLMSVKATEIGQMICEMIRGVVAMASQKVEELTKESPSSKSDGWIRNENEGYGF